MTTDDAADYARMGWGCQAGTRKNRCCGAATHYTRYRYVTGRAGRVSDRQAIRCEGHARAYAEKHGCPWPPTTAWQSGQESQSDITDRVVSSFLGSFGR